MAVDTGVKRCDGGGDGVTAAQHRREYYGGRGGGGDKLEGEDSVGALLVACTALPPMRQAVAQAAAKINTMGAELSKRVDKLLDGNERFQEAVATAFAISHKDRSGRMSIPDALAAVQYIHKELADRLPEACRDVVLRVPKQSDVDQLMQEPAFATKTAFTFEEFEAFARAICRRIVVDRGARFAAAAVAGCYLVHLGKGFLRRTPVFGPVFSLLINPLVPTVVVGPMVGAGIVKHF
eukprot:jgi/Chlat1/8756/Chrsp9S08574